MARKWVDPRSTAEAASRQSEGSGSGAGKHPKTARKEPQTSTLKQGGKQPKTARKEPQHNTPKQGGKQSMTAREESQRSIPRQAEKTRPAAHDEEAHEDEDGSMNAPEEQEGVEHDATNCQASKGEEEVAVVKTEVEAEAHSSRAEMGVKGAFGSVRGDGLWRSQEHAKQCAKEEFLENNGSIELREEVEKWIDDFHKHAIQRLNDVHDKKRKSGLSFVDIGPVRTIERKCKEAREAKQRRDPDWPKLLPRSAALLGARFCHKARHLTGSIGGLLSEMQRCYLCDIQKQGAVVDCADEDEDEGERMNEDDEAEASKEADEHGEEGCGAKIRRILVDQETLKSRMADIDTRLADIDTRLAEFDTLDSRLTHFENNLRILSQPPVAAGNGKKRAALQGSEGEHDSGAKRAKK